MGSAQDEDGEAGGKARAAQRPLEQEPLLAARIMIEDCMNLLLDVEDIDRLCTVGPPGALPPGTADLAYKPNLTCTSHVYCAMEADPRRDSRTHPALEVKSSHTCHACC